MTGRLPNVSLGETGRAEVLPRATTLVDEARDEAAGAVVTAVVRERDSPRILSGGTTPSLLSPSPQPSSPPLLPPLLLGAASSPASQALWGPLNVAVDARVVERAASGMGRGWP